MGNGTFDQRAIALGKKRPARLAVENDIPDRRNRKQEEECPDDQPVAG